MCDIHKFNRIKKILNNDALSDKKIVEKDILSTF